jgi:beta-N-acetylhexosaminidase
VRSGEVSVERLDESVVEILTWKAALGLHRSRLVDVGQVVSRVGRPDDAALGQRISDDAVTLVRDGGGLLPLEAAPPAEEGLPYQATVEPSNRLLVVVLSRDVRGLSGRVLDAEVRHRVPDARVIFVDRASAKDATETVLDAATAAESVVVAAFVAPEPGESTPGAGPDDPAARLLKGVLNAAGARTVVVAVGSPYVALGFPTIGTYLCTFSNAAVSERSAVRALFGEIGTRGHLPVTLPGIAVRGDGVVAEPR